MAKHPGLNDMARRERVATHSDQGDLDYFSAQVEPLLREYYTTLLSQNKVPYNSSYDKAMNWVRSTTRLAGNIVRSDERAFIYPILNEAHRAGGAEELRATFDDLANIYAQSHNSFIDRNADKIEKLAATIDAIEVEREKDKPKPAAVKSLIRTLGEKIVGRVTAIFNHGQRIDTLTSEAKKLYGAIYAKEPAFEDILAFARRHKSGMLRTAPIDQPDVSLRKSKGSFPSYLIKR